MSEIKGFTSGFDYLRIILSFAVLIWHSYVFTHSGADIDTVLRGPAGWAIYLILPMFFALSGFLVASSLLRTNNLPIFLWLRFVRLFPALSVEVVLSALILGPLATTFALSEYFTDREFFRYFKNLFGIVQLRLPGVFGENPAAFIVNGSLWTVPYELECYIALSILFILTLTKKPRWLGSLFIVGLLGQTAAYLICGAPALRIDHLPGRQLILLFLSGLVIYLNRDIVPKNGLAALCSFLVGSLLIRDSQLYLLAVLPLAYATVHLGLTQPKRNKVILSGDYSYGVYLYAAPIQQAAYHFTDFGKTFLGNLLLAAVFATLFAIFSWHAIEKPALKLKNLFNAKRMPASVDVPSPTIYPKNG